LKSNSEGGRGDFSRERTGGVFGRFDKMIQAQEGNQRLQGHLSAQTIRKRDMEGKKTKSWILAYYEKKAKCLSPGPEEEVRSNSQVSMNSTEKVTSRGEKGEKKSSGTGEK